MNFEEDFYQSMFGTEAVNQYALEFDDELEANVHINDNTNINNNINSNTSIDTNINDSISVYADCDTDINNNIDSNTDPKSDTDIDMEDINIDYILTMNNIDSKKSSLGFTYIARAILKGQLGVVKKLMKESILFETDVLGYNCLHFACRSPNISIIKFLLEQGFNIDDKNNQGRMCPLSISIIWKQVEVTKFLLTQNINLNSGNLRGRMPIHFAAKLGDINLVRLMFGLGANIDATDIQGNNIYHIIAEGSKSSRLIAFFLPITKADPMAKNKNGISPYDILFSCNKKFANNYYRYIWDKKYIDTHGHI